MTIYRTHPVYILIFIKCKKQNVQNVDNYEMNILKKYSKTYIHSVDNTFRLQKLYDHIGEQDIFLHHIYFLHAKIKKIFLF